MLQEMPKMLPISSDTFLKPSKQILAHILWFPGCTRHFYLNIYTHYFQLFLCVCAWARARVCVCSINFIFYISPQEEITLSNIGHKKK
jgi:hypothetical protein